MIKGLFARSVTLGAVIVFLALTICLWLLLVGRPVPNTLDPQQTPMYQVLQSEEQPIGQQAVVTVDINAGYVVRAPDSSGVITSVYVRDGEVIEPGERVIAVDGRTQYALQSQTPLYRTIMPKDSGEDVAALQNFFIDAVGVDLEPNGEYGPSTVRAYVAWLKDEGLPQDAPLTPDRFLVVPGPVKVVDSLVEVGEPYPGLGSELFVGEPSVRLTNVEVDGLPIPGYSDYRFNKSGSTAEFTVADEAWEATSDSEISSLATQNIVAEEGAPSGENSPESGSVALSGYMETSQNLQVLTLPATSLITSGDGTVCVLVRSSVEKVPVTSGVALLGTTVTGAALVDPQDIEGRELLVNPSVSQRNSMCPS